MRIRFDCDPGVRHDLVRKHRQKRRDEKRQQRQRAEDAQRADAAGFHRGHFALVIQPAERQHDSEEQADRHQHGELLQRRQPDQRGDDAAREVVLRRLPQHARELVRQQHHEQHASHGHERPRDFAQQVSVQSIEQSSRPSAGMGKLALHTHAASGPSPTTLRMCSLVSLTGDPAGWVTLRQRRPDR